MTDRSASVPDDSVSETPTTWERLKRTRCLVDSVIPVAATVNVFASRWGPIRKRLDEFPPQLAHLQTRFVSVNSILCDELMQSIDTNLVETRDLAERCVEEAFGGKLQMQSSLDAVSLKLERNLQECQLLAKADATKEKRQKQRSGSGGGGGGAARESLRDLLMRLQVGNVESKQKAMESLLNVMKEGDKNVVIVAKEGGVPILVGLLDWGNRDGCAAQQLREKAMEAMERMTQVESCERLLVAEGVAGALVRVLRCGGTANGKAKAAWAMSNLTGRTKESAEQVLRQVEGAGIGALLEVCRTGIPAAKSGAAGAIRNLARAAVSEESSSLICTIFVDEGALPVFISLINSGTALSQEFACQTLHSLCSSSDDDDDESIRQSAILHGAIPSLLLCHDRSQSPSAKQAAMAALTTLASSHSPSSLQALLASDFLPRLVASLSRPLEHEFAASTVLHLARRSVEFRKLLGDAGCIPPLVRMLEAKTSAARRLASQAIASLISVDSNRKAFCKEERSIEKMVALLDPSNVNFVDDKAGPIGALMWLAGKKKHRKEMAAAGACLFLARLADQEEEAETGAIIIKLMGRLRECRRKSKPSSSSSSSWSSLFKS